MDRIGLVADTFVPHNVFLQRTNKCQLCISKDKFSVKPGIERTTAGLRVVWLRTRLPANITSSKEAKIKTVNPFNIQKCID